MFGMVDLLLLQDLLLPIHTWHATTVQNIHEFPVADLYRWRVFKSALQTAATTADTGQVFESLEASSLATDTAGTNQLCPVENDACTILEYHDRTLY